MTTELTVQSRALAEHFDVPPEVVRSWLTEIRKAA